MPPCDDSCRTGGVTRKADPPSSAAGAPSRPHHLANQKRRPGRLQRFVRPSYLVFPLILFLARRRCWGGVLRPLGLPLLHLVRLVRRRVKLDQPLEGFGVAPLVQRLLLPL